MRSARSQFAFKVRPVTSRTLLLGGVPIVQTTPRPSDSAVTSVTGVSQHRVAQAGICSSGISSLHGYAKRDTTNWLAPSGRAVPPIRDKSMFY